MNILKFSVLFSITSLFAHLPSEDDIQINNARIQILMDERLILAPQCVAIPEGEFVYAFHPDVAGWLSLPLDQKMIRAIEHRLEPYLQIPLTKEGFTSASARRDEDEIDNTCYSAVWVRDSVWHYYGLKIQNPAGARQLILNLLKFYTTRHQFEQFISIIEDPKFADPMKNEDAYMDVPLIRFSSKTLNHMFVDGETQKWNHLQLDSHGLFLLALSDALDSKILSAEDLTSRHLRLLALFPAFFTQIEYEKAGDTGPWEEEYQRNSSSAGLVASGIKRIMEIVQSDPLLKAAFLERLDSLHYDTETLEIIHKACSESGIRSLYEKGIARVQKNLKFGGESPNLDGKTIDRTADSALLFLCVLEHAPFYNDAEKIKEILRINQGLIGPYGIYRYKLDAYQAANYWIDRGISSPIAGEGNPLQEFITRFNKGYMPHLQPYDAQWFFDSIYALACYRLVDLETDDEAIDYYRRKGDIHLKRALGQLTGPETFAANGEKVKEWQLPESINTLIYRDHTIHPMPSPICPLGWSTATMSMALKAAQTAHEPAQ